MFSDISKPQFQFYTNKDLKFFAGTLSDTTHQSRHHGMNNKKLQKSTKFNKKAYFYKFCLINPKFRGGTFL